MSTSHDCAGQRQPHAVQIDERQKWDSYYASLPMQEIDEGMRAFGEDLAGRIHELLPPESKVLEAGCGAGWQSLVLAEAGKVRPTLMDFSREALRYAAAAFVQHRLAADFVCEDVFAPGRPEYDLVFNAGVLEHYTFEEQVAFLHGMASRSRKYVLALVPNRECYWYWMWRTQQAARGEWPFGKEMPMADLSAAFQAAGLQFLGHWHGGVKWSEFFIGSLTGLDERLRDEILAVHRSPVIPERQRAYLVAALGCKGEAPVVPACWIKSEGREESAMNQFAASTADALAAAVAAEHRCKRSENRLAAQAEDFESLREQLRQRMSEVTRLCGELAEIEKYAQAAEELAALKSTRSYRLWRRFRALELWLASSSGRCKRFAQTGRRAALRFQPKFLANHALRGFRHKLKRFVAKLVPSESRRGRWARKAVRGARRARFWITVGRGLDLEQVLRETDDRKGIVIYPPFVDWNWMRQRPHHLMAQFAEAGYLSLFCSPRTQADSFRGFVRIAERLYLCDSLEPLYDIPNSLLLIGWTNHWETVKRFRSPLVIYDYLDDLRVSSEGGSPSRRKLDLHRKLVTRSDIVLATSRRLYNEVRQLRPDAIHCPNGADYAHFHPTSAPAAPADIADLVAAGRPIVGYYGTLASWFDYSLLAQAAAVRRDCTFLLIGPDLDGTMAACNLESLPNVRWIGEKKYEELPAYLHYFTVATIPFVINDITRATSPVKLFEYMAGIKPIVTTDMPECSNYSSVLVAGSPEEYVAMLDEAVHRGKLESYRRLLDKEARENTWAARTRQILAQLETVGWQTRLHSA